MEKRRTGKDENMKRKENIRDWSQQEKEREVGNNLEQEKNR